MYGARRLLKETRGRIVWQSHGSGRLRSSSAGFSGRRGPRNDRHLASSPHHPLVPHPRTHITGGARMSCDQEREIAEANPHHGNHSIYERAFGSDMDPQRMPAPWPQHGDLLDDRDREEMLYHHQMAMAAQHNRARFAAHPCSANSRYLALVPHGLSCVKRAACAYFETVEMWRARSHHAVCSAVAGARDRLVTLALLFAPDMRLTPRGCTIGAQPVRQTTTCTLFTGTRSSVCPRTCMSWYLHVHAKSTGLDKKALTAVTSQVSPGCHDGTRGSQSPDKKRARIPLRLALRGQPPHDVHAFHG